MVPEPNLSLGEFLRQERERRGITIEQVASATKIGVKTLHLLESDHYAELPAKPFIRGFVNSYARFIGLDSKEILTQYDTFVDRKTQERPNREGGHSGYAFEKRDGEQQSRMILWAVMGGFLVVGGVVGVILKPSLHHRKGAHVEKLRAAHGVTGPNTAPAVPVPASSTAASNSASNEVASAVKVVAVAEPVAEPPAPVAAPAPVSTPTSAPVPVPTPTPTATEAEAAAAPTTAQAPSENDPLDSGKDLKVAEIKHKLIVRALAGVWVRYQCDERPAHKFVLKKDKILVLRAKDSLKFQVSNPNSIATNYNGRVYKVLSENKKILSRQDTPTLLYPMETVGTIQEPFPGEKALPKTEDPQPVASEAPVAPSETSTEPTA